MPSFAKINWVLLVKGKRADGYHDVCTVFQTISLHDELEFTKDSGLKLECSDPSIPVDERNLIVKAAALLRQKYDVADGARVCLTKRIPAPGGLGGGSSNAAVALLGLAKLWDLDLSFEELRELGILLGSDVPFFFYGGTAVGAGRGTEIFPQREIRADNLIIAIPDVDISTANAFALLNAPRLTKSDSKSILQICRDVAPAGNLPYSGMINDFEKVIFQIEPEIERVKERFFELGAKHALMSGSGASVFAVFESNENLRSAFSELEDEQNWRIFKAETVSRKDYLGSLKLVERFLL